MSDDEIRAWLRSAENYERLTAQAERDSVTGDHWRSLPEVPPTRYYLLGVRIPHWLGERIFKLRLPT